MNRINRLLEEKKQRILSVYYTAGYPHPEDTLPIARQLEQSGADMIEIGIPFSDPIADGSTIQESNNISLKNGMTLTRLFDQLQGLRQYVRFPVILMGYVNPLLQYGMEPFCRSCQAVGVDGLIIPDLPMIEYRTKYRALFEQYGLKNIFLISPQTSEARIRQIDESTDAFIYMVSTAGTTGARNRFSEEAMAYFKRIEAMKLKNPRLIGFGISNTHTFEQASQFAAGAIIGSAFIKALTGSHDLEKDTDQFISEIIAN